MTIGHAEICAIVLGKTNPTLAAELLGAVDAMREREGRPRTPQQANELDTDVLPALRSLVTKTEWDHHYQQGRQQTVEDTLTQAHAETDS